MNQPGSLWKKRPRSGLALAAVLAAAWGCSESSPAGPVREAPGDAPLAAASSCGQLKPGELLQRGEAVHSCNGRTMLAHQNDGNVVLYQNGGIGPIWSTGTYGRSTTNLVMQNDGNLVLYGPSGPVWNSGTFNRPGAFLAVQDDCNLVIYQGSAIWNTYTRCRTQPKPQNNYPVPVGSPASVDPLHYMHNLSGYVLRSNFGDAQATRFDGSNLWILKRFDDAQAWEYYTVSSSQICLKRDTTSPQSEGFGTAYGVVTLPGGQPMCFPRNWAVGSTTTFSSDIRYFDHKTPGCFVKKVVGWPSGRHTLRFAGKVDLGNGMGPISLIVVDRYHNVGAKDTPDEHMPRVAERFWYAYDYGWVRFEKWNDRLADGNWNTGNIFATRPDQRITWGRDGEGSLPYAAPTCTAA